MAVDEDANLLVARSHDSQIRGEGADSAIRLGDRLSRIVDAGDGGDESFVDSRGAGDHIVEDAARKYT